MADVTIGAKLQLDANDGLNSMKAFKKEIKDAQGELLSMTDKFGATSKQAQDAAKKVAELKDKLGDARSLVDAFNPDQKFRALSQSLNGVLGGFSALTGAMGLLGVESEDVQKQLLKVQSAMALSQGLNQVGDAIQSFKNLGATLVNTLGRNGLIGLAIAGVGVLVGSIIALTKATDEETEAAKRQEEVTRKQYDASKKLVEGFDLQERKLRALGKTELEITNAREEATKKLLNDARAQLKSLELIAQATDKTFNKQQENVKKAGVRGAGGVALFNMLFGVSKKEVDEAHSNVTNIKSQIEELDVVILELNKKKKDLEKPTGAGKEKTDEAKRQERLAEEKEEQAIKDRIRKIRNTSEKPEGELKKIDEVEQEQIKADNLKSINDRLADSIVEKETWRVAKLKELHDSAIKNAEAEMSAKLDFANQTGNALGALSDLIGRQTAAGKILALATIASGTAIGYIQALDIAQKSAKGTGPAAAFAFPIFYASQIAAVLGAAAKAKAILGGGKGTTSGSSANFASGLSVSAPLQPRPQVTNTRLDSDQLNQIGNAAVPVRAFVVESDVSGSQDRIRRLNRAARI